MNNELFTIGHSTQSIESFIKLLKQHEIQAIGDVRSGPYSKRFPHFSKNELQAELKRHGIKYVFLGDEFGARRNEPCCYIGDRADYDLISKTPLFQEGLKRVKTGLEKFKIALMCAERDPLDCHRTILVSRHARAFVPVNHIWITGDIESHETLEQRLIRKIGTDENDMFRSPEERLAIAYKLRGEEIAYTRPKDQSYIGWERRESLMFD